MHGHRFVDEKDHGQLGERKVCQAIALFRVLDRARDPAKNIVAIADGLDSARRSDAGGNGHGCLCLRFVERLSQRFHDDHTIAGSDDAQFLLRRQRGPVHNHGEGEQCGQEGRSKPV